MNPMIELKRFLCFGLFFLVVTPFVSGQQVTRDDLAAALEQNLSRRPKVQFDVVLTRRFPDLEKVVENKRSSFQVAHEKTDPKYEEMFGLVKKALASEHQQAMERSPQELFFRIKELNDQVLVLSTSGQKVFGKEPDLEQANELLPVDFTPASWPEKITQRVSLSAFGMDGSSKVYTRDDMLNVSQFKVSSNDLASLEQLWIKSKFLGLPFEVNHAGEKGFRYFASALVSNESKEASIERDNENWKVTLVEPLIQLRVFDGVTNVQLNERTEYSLDPKGGYVPVSIEKRIEYLDKTTGEKLEVHPDWKQVGEFWEIQVERLGGAEHYYPQKIKYVRKVAESRNNNVPRIWMSEEEYLRLIQNPFADDVELLEEEVREIEILHVQVNERPDRLFELESPMDAVMINEIENEMRIPDNAEEQIRLSMNTEIDAVLEGGKSNGKRFEFRILFGGVLFGVCSILIYWSRKRR